MFKAFILAAVVGLGVYAYQEVNWDRYATMWNTGDVVPPIGSSMRGIGSSVGGIGSSVATALSGQ